MAVTSKTRSLGRRIPVIVASLGCAAVVSTAWSQQQGQSYLEDETVEQPRQIGDVSLGFSASSVDGAAATAALDLLPFSDSDTRLTFTGELAKDRVGARFAYFVPDMVSGADFRLTLGGFKRDTSSRFDFATQNLFIRPSLTWTWNDAQVTGYVFAKQTKVDAAGADTPAIVLPDVGTDEQFGIGGRYSRSWETGGVGDNKAFISFGAELAKFESSKSHTRLFGSGGQSGRSLNGNVAWSWRIKAGTLNTSSGNSSIADRTFLGRDAIRGFAYAGVGPIDTATQRPLGGNTYAATQLDVTFPNLLGEGSRWVPGLHLDAGSVWDLDNTGGNDDGFDLRSSAGLTMRYDLGGAFVELSASAALNKETGDRTEEIALSISEKF